MLNMRYANMRYTDTQHTTTTQDPRPKIFKNFARVLLGPPGSSQNPLFGSSGPQVLEEVVGSSIPQSRFVEKRWDLTVGTIDDTSYR